MTEKKIDRRVLYTKKAIRDSFLDLLEEKPIEKISVTEICKNADINRGTFYAHYADPYELKNSIEKELVEAFKEAERKNPDGCITANDAMRILKENKSACRIFFCKNGDMNSFMKITAKYSSSYFYGVMGFDEGISEPHKACLNTMLVAAVSALVKFWYENDMRDDPAIIAECMKNFCIGGSQKVFDGVKESFT